MATSKRPEFWAHLAEYVETCEDEECYPETYELFVSDCALYHVSALLIEAQVRHANRSTEADGAHPDPTKEI